MAHDVTFIPGDGTGPEISAATRRVLEATGVQFNWDVQDAGLGALAKTGQVLPDAVLDSVRRTKVAIKGPITTPVGKGFRSVNVALRKALDLYACVRPCKSYKGVRSRYTDIDLVIVRENTEDLYAGIEYNKDTPEARELIAWFAAHGSTIRPDSAISIKPISSFGSERVVRFAFEYARKNGRKRVTAVHKANIMKATDGLFLATAQGVAKEYSDIAFDDRIVDNMCMQLVQKPEQYDVLVLPNLYGDILSDLGAGLIGGLGVAPGANIGTDVAIFEPTHGSAPHYAGQNRVNPLAEMFSGVMMLSHLGEHHAARRLEAAMSELIAEGKDVTYDMKPDRNDPTAVGTAQVADALIAKLQRLDFRVGSRIRAVASSYSPLFLEGIGMEDKTTALQSPDSIQYKLETAAAADMAAIFSACEREAGRLGLGQTQVAGLWHYSCTLAPGLSLFNTALGLGIGQPACAGQLDALVERLRELKTSCTVPVVSDHEASGRLLQARGFRLQGQVSVLLLADTTTWRIHDRPGLAVRKLVAGETRLLGHILGGCWGAKGSAEKVLMATMPRLSIAACARVYFAWLGDTPIGAGVLLHAGERAGLYFACTESGWRGRGAHTALVRRRTQEAISLGAQTIYAQAPTASLAQRNLERNGYEVAYIRDMWVWQP